MLLVKPCFLTFSDTAYSIGKVLQTGPEIVPLDLIANAALDPEPRAERVERVLFGLRIPYLPDQAKSPDVAGSTDAERLAEVLGRQVRLASGLGKWKRASFSLRYVWHPEKGEVEIALLGQAAAAPGEGAKMASSVIDDVTRLTRATDFPVTPLVSEADLLALLDPFGADTYISEIRQADDVVRMVVSDAYVVYPFRAPLLSWIIPFKILSSQSAPCVVSTHLQPTSLFLLEQDEFARAAQIAATYADFNVQGMTYQQRIADPIGRLVSRLYADRVRRLGDPFLLTVQVASTDPIAARTVAQAFAEEITDRSRGDENEEALPSDFHILTPGSQVELTAARRTLTTLQLHDWGDPLSSPGKERLRYLVDAAGATSAFRFPVPLRGGVPGVRTRSTAPSHTGGPRAPQSPGGALSVGTFLGEGAPASIARSQLGRHALIAGLPGSGKTTTCMSLLAQLWGTGVPGQSVPFLVIEPAKREYRTLVESPIGRDLQIFTLGEEDISPFRLNPLEILPGVRVESHVSQVQACLVAALPSFGVLPALIERSLHRVYQEKGWKLAERATANDPRSMPILGDLYATIIAETDRMDHADRTKQDIRAAAAARLGALLRGGKGNMLNTRRSTPMAAIMSRPTVLELDALSDDDKALVMLFLLTFLREYLTTTRHSSELQHVTLIEEAHRVMTATAHVGNRETAADTRAQAVELASAALSEVRAAGEGLIIADQIPSRLAEDALKNTSVKIIHRLPGKDDRAAVGAAMNADKQQEDYIAQLVPGEAALFCDGYSKPTFVALTDYRRENGLPGRVPDERVASHMRPFHAANSASALPFAACQQCRSQCDYRDWITPLAYDLGAKRSFRAVMREFEALTKAGDASGAMRALAQESQRALEADGMGNNPDAAYCYLAHLSDANVSRASADRFRDAIGAGGGGSPRTI